MPVSPYLKAFNKKVVKNKTIFRRYLTKLGKRNLTTLHTDIAALEPKVWQEVKCLECSNCCRVMTPTFTKDDIKRIAAHFGQTPLEFTDQWLKYDAKDGDWVNKVQPCQFLNLKDNKCSIYDIRPSDCSGFPHLTSPRGSDYLTLYKNNIEFCPATYALVEKIQQLHG
jgi:uncharacterized protein